MRSQGSSLGSTPMIGKVRDMKILAEHFGRGRQSLRSGKILPRPVDKEGMEINGAGRAVPPSHAPAPVAPLDAAAEARDIVQAVKALNGTEMFGPENELRFQKDPQTQRMVVRLVNRKTEEVVTQAPAEYVLRLAQDQKKR